MPFYLSFRFLFLFFCFNSLFKISYSQDTECDNKCNCCDDSEVEVYETLCLETGLPPILFVNNAVDTCENEDNNDDDESGDIADCLCFTFDI